MKYSRKQATHRFEFNVVPVPASRPRVSRWGTYYGKTYKRFRSQFEKEVADFRKKFRPLLGRIEIVSMQFYCPYPKTVEREWPMGDMDNYMKAVWDSCNELIWRDDEQITDVREVIKRYDDRPRIVMVVRELPSETSDPLDS